MVLTAPRKAVLRSASSLTVMAANLGARRPITYGVTTADRLSMIATLEHVYTVQ